MQISNSHIGFDCFSFLNRETTQVRQKATIMSEQTLIKRQKELVSRINQEIRKQNNSEIENSYYKKRPNDCDICKKRFPIIIY